MKNRTKNIAEPDSADDLVIKATEEQIDTLIESRGENPEQVAAGVAAIIASAVGDYRQEKETKEKIVPIKPAETGDGDEDDIPF